MPKEIEDLWQKGINIAKDAGAEIVEVSYQIQLLYQLII